MPRSGSARPAQWVVEEYPVDDVTELSDPPGWIEVRLPVSSERWLAKLLIRLGPNAVALDPEAAAAAGELARRVLAGYSDT